MRASSLKAMRSQGHQSVYEPTQHDLWQYYEGDGGLPPDPIHGVMTYYAFRHWCECERGKDHIVMYVPVDNTKRYVPKLLTDDEATELMRTLRPAKTSPNNREE